MGQQFGQLDGFRADASGPRVSGHRGARGALPENTIEGFAFCQQIGIASIEFDVVMTKDRVPVVVHNHTLDGALARDAEGHWLPDPGPRVAEMTLAEVRACNVGMANRGTEYGRRFSDQAVLPHAQAPTLDDVLTFVAKPENASLSLLLELKTDPDAPDLAQERAEMVATVVAQVRAAGLVDRTVMHSFDWGILDVARAQAPEMPTSYLSYLPKGLPGEDTDRTVMPSWEEVPASMPNAVVEAGGQMWCPHFLDVTPEGVAEAHALGLVVGTWTVNSVKEINRMIDCGVDSIVTDYPGRVQDCLLRRAAS
ncbi:glycerophosphodiester phosphodiesterase family protein [Shimia sp. MMG029]|uniref:glycerophosphodiester phosphodiesterase family protein n=1 Tax=Shimia sp. MMG029 TaxID=3021978 RepID=UPI0022FDB1C4|nr:glycerophosphodiester phosphodiesterase family protein [Shimia sp. MMG029]MDA5558282.1 glycerophosphodiester phosphodiesterase family protein [Shimia sp. MMG029]